MIFCFLEKYFNFNFYKIVLNIVFNIKQLKFILAINKKKFIYHK